jgi:hypothetical protein
VKAPSALVRLLQILAIGLAVAIVVQLALLARQDSPVPMTPGEPAAKADAPAAEAVLAAARDAAPAPAAPAPAAPEPAKTAESPGCVLFGCIRRADGTPPPRGQLWLSRDGRQVGSSSTERGTYVFAGLAPGKHSLRSRIEDELPLAQDVLVRAPRTRLDLQLPGAWRLTVNAVTPEGKPLLEALPASARQIRGHSQLTAHAFREPPGELPLSNMRTIEAGLGRFRGQDPFGRNKALPKQTVGILTMPAGEPVHVALVLRSTILATMPATPGQEELTFVLSPEAFVSRLATVRLRVVDATGAPVTTARVGMSDAQSSGSGGSVDAEGRITLANLTPGILDLDITAKDLCGPPVMIEVRSGADLDLGDVQLVPPARVEFELAAKGNNDSLRVIWLDPPGRPGWQANDMYFTGDGFRSLSLYPGRYGAHYRTKAGSAVLEFDTRALPAQPIRLAVQQGAALAVRNRPGGGLARLRLCSVRGALLMDAPLHEAWESTLQVPHGDYIAEITDAAGRVVRREIHVAAGGAELNLP